jgi:hypothetical protein
LIIKFNKKTLFQGIEWKQSQSMKNRIFSIHIVPYIQLMKVVHLYQMVLTQILLNIWTQLVTTNICLHQLIIWTQKQTIKISISLSNQRAILLTSLMISITLFQMKINWIHILFKEEPIVLTLQHQLL